MLGDIKMKSKTIILFFILISTFCQSQTDIKLFELSSREFDSVLVIKRDGKTFKLDLITSINLVNKNQSNEREIEEFMDQIPNNLSDTVIIDWNFSSHLIDNLIFEAVKDNRIEILDSKGRKISLIYLLPYHRHSSSGQMLIDGCHDDGEILHFHFEKWNEQESF